MDQEEPQQLSHIWDKHMLTDEGFKREDEMSINSIILVVLE